MADLFDNPMGLMGFEFVEFASPTPDTLEPVFEKLGFTLVAHHRSKDVVLYRQGGINFIVNREPKSPAATSRQTDRRRAASRFACRTRMRRTHAPSNSARSRAHRPDGTAPARDKGHRRCAAHLIDRFEDGESIYDIETSGSSKAWTGVRKAMD